jgi:hypothetical protein
MMRIWFVTWLFCASLARVWAAAPSENSAGWQGRILVVENPTATVAFDPQPSPVREMVRAGIVGFTGAKDESAAWLSLVSIKDKVGIKVYSAPGASGTRKAVAESVVQGLLSAGLPPQQIVVWDRRLSDLRQAGFFDLAERYHVRIAGALEAGFDDKQFYETALLGKLVYGDHEFGKAGDDIGRRSFVSTLVTTNITKIINLVPLLNHNLAGVVGNLHSLAMGSVDNILRFESDPDRLASAIPEIYALEPIGDKVVLSVVDALIAQYQGEERTLYHYAVCLNELWFSKDPVALDILSIHELARQRKQADAPPLRTNLDIFTNAALLDLGFDDPTRFRIERLKIK